MITNLLITLVLAMARFSKTVSAPPNPPVAVIELFTSQGCSSCPPADRLLTETIQQARVDKKAVYALSFHVDYWNRLGVARPLQRCPFFGASAAICPATHNGFCLYTTSRCEWSSRVCRLKPCADVRLSFRCFEETRCG